jgi:hypothetical protein
VAHMCSRFVRAYVGQFPTSVVVVTPAARANNTSHALQRVETSKEFPSRGATTQLSFPHFFRSLRHLRAIQCSMIRRVGFTIFMIFGLCLVAMAGTPGTFRGVLVEGPTSSRSDGWVFVKGKNGMLRKVEIQRADVHYEESFPQAKRKGTPKAALKPGIEVRVTATQGTDGEWHASEVEIVDPDSAKELPPDPDTNHRITLLFFESSIAALITPQ